MKYLIFIIGLALAVWGIWFIQTDPNLDSTKMLVEYCNKSYAGSSNDWLDCSANAWSRHDAGKNQAFVFIIIGSVLALTSGFYIRNSKHVEDRKNSKQSI